MSDNSNKNSHNKFIKRLIVVEAILFVLIVIFSVVALVMKNSNQNLDTPQPTKSVGVAWAKAKNGLITYTEYEREGEYWNIGSLSTMNISSDGVMTFHLKDLRNQEDYFGSSKEGDYVRQLYKFKQAEDEYEYAFFTDPDNGDYSIVKVDINHNNPYYVWTIKKRFAQTLFHEENDILIYYTRDGQRYSKSKEEIQYYKSPKPQITTDTSDSKTTYNTSSSRTGSSSSSSGRNSSGKKDWKKLTCDPDDYDDPDDYADDACGEDFDDWDEAYDFYEDW